MLGLENVESRKASVLVTALQEEQITVGEFRDAITFLNPEALQVLACIISLQTSIDRTPAIRLWRAHRLCSSTAALHRGLC